MSASSRHKPSISDDTAERGSPEYTNSTLLHSVPVSDTAELAIQTDRSGHQPLAYRPLDVNRKEIRLLSLQPSADDTATLQFTFSSAHLESDVPPYEALSYVWGEPDFVVPILVDDQHANITQHLAEILTFLRSEDAPRILWIDAICINQSDNAERTQQVQMMKDVFSSCRQVLAWVGPTIPAYPEEWADHLVKSQGRAEIKRFQGVKCSSPWKDTYDTYRRIAEEMDSIRTAIDQSPSGSIHQAEMFPQHLSKSDYWNRVWIVQEIACGPNVVLVCGRTLLDWKHIAKILRKEPYLDAYHGYWNLAHYRDGEEHSKYDFQSGKSYASKALALSEMKSLVDQRLAFHSSIFNNYTDLLDTLARFSHRLARDPRDSVFALLGLVRSNHDIQIDYNKARAGVFQDTTLAILRLSQNLDILCQNPFELRIRPDRGVLFKSSQKTASKASGFRTEKLPTWVAQFDSRISDRKAIIFAQRGIFSAGTKTFDTPCVVADHERNILAVKGVIIDQIGAVYRKFHDWEESGRTHPWLPREDVSTLYQMPKTSFDDSEHYSASKVLRNASHQTTQASLAHTRQSPDLIASGGNFARISENRTQAYWRTMIKDCTAPPHVRRLSDLEIEQLHRVHARSLIRWDGNWTYYTLAPDGVRQYVYGHSRSRRTDEVTRASSLNLHIISYQETGGMFATTSNGLFVNTRRHVAPGDVVAVLDGGKLPVILRKVPSSAEGEESQQLYHFVAPAYVHGIMDGEVEDAVSRGWLLKQDILLA